MRYTIGNTIPKPTLLIEQLCDERPNGGEWLVYLKPGWAILDNDVDNAAQHCFGEETKRDVWQTMKRARPCRCTECKPAWINGHTLTL